MSYLTYFAADKPLPEQANPFVQTLSINQALNLGLELDLELLSELDRDEPEVILFCADESKLSYPNIYGFDGESFSDGIGTTKPYTVGVDHGELTSENLSALVEYVVGVLQDHLQIELWSVWLGGDSAVRNPQKTAILLAELSQERLREFFDEPVENKCLTITR